MPAPPPIQEPEEEVPSAVDEVREAEEAEKLERMNRNRKGRRATILTTPDYENTEAEVAKKTLLGG